MLTVDPTILQELDVAAIALGPADAAALRRAAHLPAQQRLLVELVYRYQLPCRRVAQFVHMEPGSVSRAARRLWNRLCHPLVVQICDRDCPLPAPCREVGIDFFLRRKSARVIARQRGVSIRRVAETIAFLRGWHHGTPLRRAAAGLLA